MNNQIDWNDKMQVCAGRHDSHSGRVRLRQDGDLAVAVQVLQQRRDHLRRLWRARQWDGRGAQGLPAAHHGSGRSHRVDHEAHVARRQHVQHARGGPRGLHLHRHHAQRVLPRHGLQRGHDGRLDVALGRSVARDLGPLGRNARRRRLSGLLGGASRLVLRARRSRQVHRQSGTRGLRHHCGRRLAARRWLRRSGHRGHAQHCAGLLGSGQEARPAQALSVRQLAAQLQQVHARPRRLLREELRRVRAAAHQVQGDPAGRGGLVRDCATRRQERARRDRQDHARGRQAHQGRLLAAERLHNLR